MKYEYFEHYLEVLYKDSMSDYMNETSSTDICFVYVIAEALLDVRTRNLAVKALYDWMR